MSKHNAGLSTYTKRGIPWIIIHKESFKTRREALKREKFLKNGIGHKWLDQKYPQYKMNPK